MQGSSRCYLEKFLYLFFELSVISQNTSAVSFCPHPSQIQARK
jgi:hypothetical protein